MALQYSCASVLLVLGVLSTPACGESDSENSEVNRAEGGDGDGDELDGEAPRRVVAYLPTYRNLDPANVDFDTVTHLCIAFANPTGVESESDFDAAARDKIAPLVEAAHAQGVLVLASIAGGTQESGDLVGEQLVPDKVDAYVAGLLEVVERYNLDGIDNDIEGDAISNNYEDFVLKLSAALPDGKLLTAAVATKNGDPVSDKSLAEYDFINIMAYDHCSWADEACDQASVAGVMEDIEYWTVERGIPRRQAVIGVPFYGWCWGCAEKQSALTYGQIIRQYPEAATIDWIVDGDKTISLNSAATIAEKAQLAHEYGGLMIWELGQDAIGDDALMKVVAVEQLPVE